MIYPPECQASVTVEAVPAQVGDFESFASHGLHWMQKDGLHMSDFYRHAWSESAQHLVSIISQTHQTNIAASMSARNTAVASNVEAQ